ncbi:OBERON-like protein [Hibiscus syriacus]|uniref:OBERON-like protein n=1 Tax=Hibiscus syriacus TaxID=106335 RepID=A0A6A3AZ63_HIBSY|nr:OBERON-like protein [Hibiscus syriacus]
MVFHCRACNQTSELLGWVKDVFQHCAAAWDREALMRELDFVSGIFRGSDDPRGKKLFLNLDNGEDGELGAPQEACNRITDVVQEAIRKIDMVADEKLRMFKKARLALDACERELEDKAKEVAELKLERQKKKVQIEELEKIIKLQESSRASQSSNGGDPSHHRCRPIRKSAIFSMDTMSPLKQTLSQTSGVVSEQIPKELRIISFIRMLGCSGLSRTTIFRAENLGHNALHAIANLCFTIFVIGVLVFTIIAAASEPWDPLFHPSTKITIFLTSTSSATFQSDSTVVRTGEDFTAANQTAFSTFINVTDVVETKDASADEISLSDVRYPLLSVWETTPGPNRFGKPTPGPRRILVTWHGSLGLREKTTAFYKDYRRFVVKRLKNCKLSVVSIGDYHSGVNARKKHKNQKPGFEKSPSGQEQGGVSFPVVGETVNDSLPVVESENAFSSGKYLIYVGGGDRCKNMDHYLWSFLCALGEAQYLNRTLVMDLTICLSSVYTLSNQDEEGKDFRFYFDFEHLKETASVLDQRQFWEDWNKWQRQDGLSLYLVEDFKVTPMRLSEVRDSLIVRRFGPVEPDNYWYRVCEGDTESVVRRPWHLRRESDEQGMWPNLAQDTSPDALISTLQDKIEDGRSVYCNK